MNQQPDLVSTESQETVVDNSVNNVNTKTLTAEEYNELINLKAELSTLKKQLQEKPVVKQEVEKKDIDEVIEKERQLALKKQQQEDAILKKAQMINEVNDMASRYLQPDYQKDRLLNKGFSTDEIITAQKKELIKKFVPSPQIKAISKTDDIKHVDGHVLDQLYDLAKTNIDEHNRKKQIVINSMNSNSKDTDDMESQSFLNPNFTAFNHDEFVQAMKNTYHLRIMKEFYSQ